YRVREVMSIGFLRLLDIAHAPRLMSKPAGCGALSKQSRINRLLDNHADAEEITAAFDGGGITSDGGVMLLAQAERRLGIAERLAQVIPDPRDQDPGTPLPPAIM